ncbi:MAG: hypothetical protein J6X55_11285 [Victivallales bacterium]|nr:hypothetical protein [Victivallales bacterium]
MLLKDIRVRVEGLQSELKSLASASWIRPPQYQNWVVKLNLLIRKGNNLLQRSFPLYGIQESDYSSSKKTINSGGIDRLNFHIEELLKILIEAEKKEDEKHLQCFLVNEKCPHRIQNGRYSFFIGMPFADKYDDVYRYGIALVLDSYGLTHYRADQSFERRQLMCKICQAIQEANYVLIDISDNNPNVMFELGITCGLGKPVILIKDIQTKVATDLSEIEYLEYNNSTDLQKKLTERLKQWGIC